MDKLGEPVKKKLDDELNDGIRWPLKRITQDRFLHHYNVGHCGNEFWLPFIRAIYEQFMS